MEWCFKMPSWENSQPVIGPGCPCLRNATVLQTGVNPFEDSAKSPPPTYWSRSNDGDPWSLARSPKPICFSLLQGGFALASTSLSRAPLTSVELPVKLGSHTGCDMVAAEEFIGWSIMPRYRIRRHLDPRTLPTGHLTTPWIFYANSTFKGYPLSQ